MSKSLKNYPDPMGVVNKYGADAVRMFLVNSPVVRADNLRFKEDGVRDVLTNVILKWINSLNFYLGQVDLFEQTTGKKFMYEHDAPKSANVMDRWILATCQTLIQHVDAEMAGELQAFSASGQLTCVSVPALHCHPSLARPHRGSDKLVHSLQSIPVEGIWWH